MAWKWLKRLAGIAILALVAVIIVRAVTLYAAYTWLLHKMTDAGGLDVDVARPATLAILALMSFIPLRALLVPWFNSARRRAVVGSIGIASALGAAGMAYLTRDVFFAQDGHPTRFYILTMQGYRFSDTPGVDHTFGVKRQPVTAEVYREYLIWQKGGGQARAISGDQNFNALTGEPERWYVPGTCESRPLPGYDGRTGQQLVPATTAVVARCDAQAATAQQRRQEDERRRQAAEARRRHEEERKTKQEADRAKQDLVHHLALPGRYIYFGQRPSVVIDAYQFELREADVLQDHVCVHLGVTNLNASVEGAWHHFGESPPVDGEQVSFRYSVVDSDGNVLAASLVRREEGPISETGRTGLLPPPASDARFYVEFPRIGNPERTFTVAINERPVSEPSLYRFTYKSF
jgi:hypothetical protein